MKLDAGFRKGNELDGYLGDWGRIPGSVELSGEATLYVAEGTVELLLDDVDCGVASQECFWDLCSMCGDWV
jgi:hypothetical protein